MRIKSHVSHTLIAQLASAVNEWRRAEGWSRKPVVQVVVEHHQRVGGEQLTGLVFAPPSIDPFDRAKASADRVFRWLDDQTKDTNLMPANFLPSLLGAMPLARRAALAGELLHELGLAVRPLVTVDSAGGLDAVEMLQSLLARHAEAASSVAELVDGIDPGELARAQAGLAAMVAAGQQALHLVEAALARQGAQ